MLRGVRVAVAVPGDQHVCGLDAEGALHCAGNNHAGLLMQPPEVGETTLADALAPDGTGWSRVSLGDYAPGFPTVAIPDPHACGVTRGGRTYCWGSNTAGQLGAPSEVTCVSRFPYLPCSPTPLPIPSVRAPPPPAAGRLLP